MNYGKVNLHFELSLHVNKLSCHLKHALFAPTMPPPLIFDQSFHISDGDEIWMQQKEGGREVVRIDCGEGGSCGEGGEGELGVSMILRGLE